eukprot:UN27457
MLFGGDYFNYVIFLIGFGLVGYLTYYLVDDVMELEEDLCLYISLGVGVAGGILLGMVHKLSVFSCGAIGGLLFTQFVVKIIHNEVREFENLGTLHNPGCCLHCIRFTGIQILV